MDDLLVLFGAEGEKVGAAFALWTPSFDIEYVALADLLLNDPAGYAHPSGFRQRVGLQVSAYGLALSGGAILGPELDEAGGENIGLYLSLSANPGRLGGSPVFPTPRNLERVRRRLNHD